jgi:hypothetical protein
MLNQQKLIKEIERLDKSLFSYNNSQIKTACDKWQDIGNDENFAKRVAGSKSSFLLPSWHGRLTDTFEIKPELKKYSVFAVDGSQVYPDRHMSGINCFLINTGQALLEYSQPSIAKFQSDPYILTPEKIIPAIQDHFAPDFIDLKREEMELETAFKKACELNIKYRAQFTPLVVLIDGSIIFWQLEGKHPEIKKYFLSQYMAQLNNFYEHKIPMAGYISMPKSKELVNLVKIGLCRFEKADCIKCHSEYTVFPCKEVDHVLDTQLKSEFLPTNHRSTIFYSNSKITELYPEHLKPCFVYLNVGKEIARLEFPLWVTQKLEHLDLLCKVAIDQAIKGQGYPVVLSEAHEQAVIKSSDKDLFLQLIYKKSIMQKRRILLSPKSLKKHLVNI